MRWRTVLRVVVLTHSILLAGMFVAYRAGAFERLTLQKLDISPGSGIRAADVSQADEINAPQLMGSSKYTSILAPEANAPTHKDDQTFMGSSKTLILVEPKPPGILSPPQSGNNSQQQKSK